MGLDMYMFRKNMEKKKVFVLELNKESLSLIPYYTEVMYWRKANQINYWFGRHLSPETNEIKNDFEYYDVPIDMVKKLIKDCKTVLKSKNKKDAKDIAMDLIPTQNGFFFGNTEINDDYYSTLENTIAMLKDIVKDVETRNKNGEICSLAYAISY